MLNQNSVNLFIERYEELRKYEDAYDTQQVIVVNNNGMSRDTIKTLSKHEVIEILTKQLKKQQKEHYSKLKKLDADKVATIKSLRHDISSHLVNINNIKDDNAEVHDEISNLAHGSIIDFIRWRRRELKEGKA